MSSYACREVVQTLAADLNSATHPLVGILPCLLLHGSCRLLCCYWTTLSVRQSVLGAAVTHQVAQITKANSGDFVHANKERGTNRQAVMANLANDRWTYLEHARQSRVVLQVHLAQ